MEPKTWYEIASYNTPKITPVRVLRETSKQIVLADCHPGNARRNKAHTYFPTWSEAHEYLLHEAEARVIAARRTLERERGAHESIKSMRPSTLDCNLPPSSAAAVGPSVATQG